MRHPFYKGVVLGSVVSLVVLMATTALAGSGVGGVFHLGKTNTVNRATYLTGTTSGKLLQVKNKGSGTALSLRVKAGRPPLAVNSTARVKRLNADMVDGLHASDLQKVYTARRDLAVSASFEDILTVPGLGRVSVRSPAPGWFYISVNKVDEAICYAHPDGNVVCGAAGVRFEYSELSPGKEREDSVMVWNSTRVAALEFSWMRRFGSDQLTVFVQATVQ